MVETDGYLPDASAWDKLFKECRLKNYIHIIAVTIFIVSIRGFNLPSVIEDKFLKRLKCLFEYFIILLNIGLLFTKKPFKINISYFLKHLFYFKESFCVFFNLFLKFFWNIYHISLSVFFNGS